MRDPLVETLDRDGTWRALTTLPQKFALHGADSFFRESWSVATDVLGDRAAGLFQRMAIVTMKPDLVVSRGVEDCMRYMAAHGFRPVHAELFRYNRTTTRELWRYQWNVATLDRIELSDVVHRRAPALTMFFLDTSTPLAVPAAARMTTLKGSAFPSAREGFHLRTVLGAPNRVLVLVHCPDEPMDIVRELGVIFDRPRLRRVYRRLGAAVDSGASIDAAAEIRLAYAQAERGHLDVARAIGEVGERIAGCARTSDKARQRSAAQAADRLREAVTGGGSLRWREWSAELSRCGVGAGSWDVALAASHLIQHDLPDSTCLITETGRRRWLSGEGLMLASA
ncbi:hypothetical protein ACLQ2Y_13975 [Micromonospora echinospora]|uniref:hypothetical protein n=1 Tax=Micromonospora echinospora TaxID=1877 RepID=UPI003CEF53A9